MKLKIELMRQQRSYYNAYSIFIENWCPNVNTIEKIKKETSISFLEAKRKISQEKFWCLTQSVYLHYIVLWITSMGHLFTVLFQNVYKYLRKLHLSWKEHQFEWGQKPNTHSHTNSNPFRTLIRRDIYCLFITIFIKDRNGMIGSSWAQVYM